MWLFRGLMMLVILSLTANVLLGGITTWLYLSQESPRYFNVATDSEQAKLMEPAAKPFVTNQIILNFAQEAALATTSLNFFDYQRSLDNAEKYFTPNGFDAFNQALTNSGELNKIIQQSLVAVGVVTGVPVITSQKFLMGNETWTVDIPMIVMYEGSSAQLPRKVLVRLLIGRVSTDLTKQGILISRYSLMKRVS